jgi:hypothetical protein
MGSGNNWPADIVALHEFYRDQVRRRPDWHIEVRETVEVGEWVAVRASAGGTTSFDDLGIALIAPIPKAIEWVALFQVVGGRIVETNLVSVIEC